MNGKSTGNWLTTEIRKIDLTQFRYPGNSEPGNTFQNFDIIRFCEKLPEIVIPFYGNEQPNLMMVIPKTWKSMTTFEGAFYEPIFDSFLTDAFHTHGHINLRCAISNIWVGQYIPKEDFTHPGFRLTSSKNAKHLLLKTYHCSYYKPGIVCANRAREFGYVIIPVTFNGVLCRYGGEHVRVNAAGIISELRENMSDEMLLEYPYTVNPEEFYHIDIDTELENAKKWHESSADLTKSIRKNADLTKCMNFLNAFWMDIDLRSHPFSDLRVWWGKPATVHYYHNYGVFRSHQRLEGQRFEYPYNNDGSKFLLEDLEHSVNAMKTLVADVNERTDQFMRLYDK